MKGNRCAYCGDTNGVIKCQCGKYFCNGRIGNNGSCQIVNHLIVNKHFSVSVNGIQLKCSKCEETNIYNLRYKIGSQDFICTHCLKKEKYVTKILYSNQIIYEGSFVVDNYEIGQSITCVKQSVADQTEKTLPKGKSERVVKNCYDSVKEYCETYQELSNFEKNEEEFFEEREFHEKEKELSFKEENGITYVSLELNKPIGGLTSEDTVIISCGGNKGMIRKENFGSVKIMASTIFASSKCVFAGKVNGVASKKVTVELENDYFVTESFNYDSSEDEDTAKIQVIKMYPTNEPKWTFNSSVVKSTKLFRVFFLTKDKGNRFSRTLEVFIGREIDDYYRKIMGIPLLNAQRIGSYELYQVNTPEIKNPNKLNFYQKKAVMNALNHDVSLIVGPPGTGKTTVAVSVVQNLLFFKRSLMSNPKKFKVENINNKRVLVCASSNNAVDVICAKLIEKGIKTVRIVADEQLGSCVDVIRKNSLLKKALDYCHKSGTINFEVVDTTQEVDLDPDDFGSIKEYKKELRERQTKEIPIRFLIKKKFKMFLNEDEQRQIQLANENYSSNAKFQVEGSFDHYLKKHQPKVFKINERTKHRMTKQENDYINKFIKEKFDDILSGIDCVCSTLTICTRHTILSQKFFASVIDEAAQSLEPETLAGVMNVRKTVLIGDIQQLQPTCLSTEARNAGLQKSMFERLMANKSIPKTMLRTQYRMHPAICEFSNNSFYSSKLENGITEIDGYDARTYDFFPRIGFPIVFINCKGKEFNGTNGTSVGNNEEFKILKQLVEELGNRNINDEEIGLISPYQTQQDLIQSDVSSKIQVANIDGFQGNEKEYIIFSCVRSNETIGVGFVGDYKRLNVAITRAKKGLFVIGNIATLKKSRVWEMFIHHLMRKQCIFEWSERKFVEYDSKKLKFSSNVLESPFQVEYSLDDIEDPRIIGHMEKVALEKQKEYEREYKKELERKRDIMKQQKLVKKLNESRGLKQETRPVYSVPTGNPAIGRAPKFYSTSQTTYFKGGPSFSSSLQDTPLTKLNTPFKFIKKQKGFVFL